ncbi:hypothetical protein JCM10450v2_004462 [Rhodotorula kratochvilovae]
MTPSPLDLSAAPAPSTSAHDDGAPAITVDSPVLPSAAADSSPPSSPEDAPGHPRAASVRGMPQSRTAASARNARARSRSPAPATTQSLDALSSPAVASPQGAARSPAPPQPANPTATLSRPSPVVPPSPSVPPTPSFSRPTSPRPPPAARGASEEPASPTRSRAHAGGEGALLFSGTQDGAALSHSGSQVDLSHIFERDVEFAPSHHISPSEAVDVAVPPVLTEAAVALSHAAEGDPITSRDLAALVLDAEHDAAAGSGWSSPVIPPSFIAHASPPPLSQQQHDKHQQPAAAQHPLSHVYANASRSPTRGTRSFSPDSGSGGRAASPGSSTFSVGTPPTSTGGGSPPPPPQSGSLGPFSQRLAEALENEANKPGLGAPLLGAVVGQHRETSPEGGLAPGLTSAPSSPPTVQRTSSSSQQYTPLKPSLLLPFPAPGHGLAGADDPFSSPLHSPSHELPANPLAAPHPRKLSFASYADLVNEERLAELTGERLADAGAGAVGGSATPGAGVGAASPVQGRSRSGTRSGGHALGLQVDQLEGRLAAATLQA